MFRKLPDSETIARWLQKDIQCEGHKMAIPTGHANAFCGILRTDRPIPILDESVVIQNLMRGGLNDGEIVQFLKSRSVYRKDGLPMIARTYDFDFS